MLVGPVSSLKGVLVWPMPSQRGMLIEGPVLLKKMQVGATVLQR